MRHLETSGVAISNLMSVQSGDLSEMKVIVLTSPIAFDLYEAMLCKLAEGSDNLTQLRLGTTLTKEQGLRLSSLLPHIGPNATSMSLPQLISSKDHLVNFVMSRADGTEEVFCDFDGVDCSKQEFVSTLMSALTSSGRQRRKRLLTVDCGRYESDGNKGAHLDGSVYDKLYLKFNIALSKFYIPFSYQHVSGNHRRPCWATPAN